MTLKGYRKWTLAVGIVIIATGLVLFHRITADNFVDLTKWVAGLYLSANFAQAVGVKLAEKVEVAPKTETKP